MMTVFDVVDRFALSCPVPFPTYIFIEYLCIDR